MKLLLPQRWFLCILSTDSRVEYMKCQLGIYLFIKHNCALEEFFHYKIKLGHALYLIFHHYSVNTSYKKINVIC